MTDSKQAILNALRAQKPPDAALPDVTRGEWITFPDPVAQFDAVLTAVGGNCVRITTIDDLRRELDGLPTYSRGAKVYSLVPGIECRNVDPQSITDAHQLEDIDFALLPGHFAVAENAAVWVTDEGVPHRAIYFIAQHVALVVPATEVVHNMHEAYQRLHFERSGFGCFISGPSKTADIEQSLVIGAHGAALVDGVFTEPACLAVVGTTGQFSRRRYDDAALRHSITGMSQSSPEFDLRCPHCGWITVCGPARMADWLRRYRLLKGTSDVETDLLVELFRASAGKLACPQCGKTALVASPVEPQDDEAWGEPRKCESCGAPIPPERLEIFPDTRLCVACQNRDERGELTGPAEYCPNCGSVMVLKRSGGLGITRYVMTCPACRRNM